MLDLACSLLCQCALVLFLLLPALPASGQQQQIRVSLPLNSSQIIYSPFLCESTFVNPDDDLQCRGAWKISNGTVYTDGPDPSSGRDTIPQLFTRFKGASRASLRPVYRLTLVIFTLFSQLTHS
jgi:hypothetical protein